MSRQARRKQKIEYEPDPIISPPKAPDIDAIEESDTHPTQGGVHVSKPTVIVTPTSAKHQGITELMERAARIAENNPKPQKIGIPSVQNYDPTDSVISTPTTSKTEVEPKPTSPMDVGVHGYANVIGAKEKKVKHT